MVGAEAKGEPVRVRPSLPVLDYEGAEPDALHTRMEDDPVRALLMMGIVAMFVAFVLIARMES
jgi:hypothetical protein